MGSDGGDPTKQVRRWRALLGGAAFQWLVQEGETPFCHSRIWWWWTRAARRAAFACARCARGRVSRRATAELRAATTPVVLCRLELCKATAAAWSSLAAGSRGGAASWCSVRQSSARACASAPRRARRSAGAMAAGSGEDVGSDACMQCVHVPARTSPRAVPPRHSLCGPWCVPSLVVRCVLGALVR